MVNITTTTTCDKKNDDVVYNFNPQTLAALNSASLPCLDGSRPSVPGREIHPSLGICRCQLIEVGGKVIQLILAISELKRENGPKLNHVDKKPGLAWTANYCQVK